MLIVVLVDRRRHDEQRDLADLLGGGPVLDQLEDVGAQHHRTRAHGDVAAHLEARSVDHGRDPRTRRHVPEEMAGTAQQTAPGGVDRGLGRGGVDQRDVARGGGLDEVVEEEAHALVVAPVEVGVGDELVKRLPGGQVSLDQPAQDRVLGPARIGEPPVPARGRDRRRAGNRLGELTAERGDPPPGRPRVAGEPHNPPNRRRVGGEPAQRTERGVDEQGVDWCRLLGGVHLRREDDVAGHPKLQTWSGRTAPAGRARRQPMRGTLRPSTGPAIISSAQGPRPGSCGVQRVADLTQRRTSALLTMSERAATPQIASLARRSVPEVAC
ncbi:MAG: hypothetical protein JWQ37_3508 [Blastococcus sp.]|nr:hypothetical protein [Blastococcus sp.]